MLRRTQVRQLRDAGYTDWEIGTINENLRQRPQVLNLSEPVWQEAMKKRHAWRERWCVQNDKGMRQFSQMVNAYYRKSKQGSPWDWLKIEYPSFARRARVIKDFQVKAAKRAKERLSGVLGKGVTESYGKRRR